MKNKAVFVVIMSFFFGVSSFALYLAYDFYQSDNRQLERGLKTVDSLQQVGKWKAGKIEKIFWLVDSAKRDNSSFVTYMLPVVIFSDVDTTFILSSVTMNNLPGSLSDSRVQYIYHVAHKRFEVIEWWADGKLRYSITEYLQLKKSTYVITISLLVFGIVFGGLAIMLLTVLCQFVMSWIKLMDDIKLRYLVKKKIPPANALLLEFYLKKWKGNFIIYLITGAIMTFVTFIFPVRFFGLREMLRYAWHDRGNETLASTIGYVPVFIGLAAMFVLFLIEYLLGLRALQRDIMDGEMVTYLVCIAIKKIIIS